MHALMFPGFATPPFPFGLSLSKPCVNKRGTSTGSVRTGFFLGFVFRHAQ